MTEEEHIKVENPDEKWNDAICVGWMKKRGGFVKNWKRRFFILSSRGTLYYFSKPSTKKPLGDVKVLGSRVCVDSQMKKKNCIIIESPKRMFYFFSESLEERDKWLKYLVLAGGKFDENEEAVNPSLNPSAFNPSGGGSISSSTVSDSSNIQDASTDVSDQVQEGAGVSAAITSTSGISDSIGGIVLSSNLGDVQKEAGIIDSIAFRIQEIEELFNYNFFSQCVKEEEYKSFVQSSLEGSGGKRRRMKKKLGYQALMLIEGKLKIRKCRERMSKECGMILHLREEFLKWANESMYKKIKERVKDLILALVDQTGLFNISLCWVVKSRELISITELNNMMVSKMAKETGTPFGRYHVGLEFGSYYTHFCDRGGGNGEVETFNKYDRSYMFGKSFIRIPLFFCLPSDMIIQQICFYLLDEEGSKGVREIGKLVYDGISSCIWERDNPYSEVFIEGISHDRDIALKILEYLKGLEKQLDELKLQDERKIEVMKTARKELKKMMKGFEHDAYEEEEYLKLIDVDEGKEWEDNLKEFGELLEMYLKKLEIDEVNYQTVKTTFDPEKVVSKIVRKIREWKKKKYKKVKQNCQHFFFDIMASLKLVEKKKVPDHYHVADLNIGKVRRCIFSSESINFMNSVWMYPKCVHFSHLGVNSDNIHWYVNKVLSFSSSVTQHEKPKDVQLLRIANDYFVQRGKFADSQMIIDRNSKQKGKDKNVMPTMNVLTKFQIDTMKKFYGSLQISLDEYALDASKFTLDSSTLLGSGGFADVHRVLLSPQPSKQQQQQQSQKQMYYAYKKLRIRDLGSSYEVCMARLEVKKVANMMLRMNHPNIIGFRGFDRSRNNMGLVLELCKESMHSFLRREVTKKEAGEGGERNLLGIENKLRILTQVASGCCYLHGLDYMHRDLKWDNVLISQDGMIKICDFGTSKKYESVQENTQRVGTIWFCAPEVLFGKKYTLSCDVYSFAVMMFQILYEEMDLSKVWYGSLVEFSEDKEQRPKLDFSGGDDGYERVEKLGVRWWMRNLIKDCWHEDPSRRPSFRVILNSLFLGEYDSKKMNRLYEDVLNEEKEMEENMFGYQQNVDAQIANDRHKFFSQSIFVGDEIKENNMGIERKNQEQKQEDHERVVEKEEEEEGEEEEKLESNDQSEEQPQTTTSQNESSKQTLEELEKKKSTMESRMEKWKEEGKLSENMKEKMLKMIGEVEMKIMEIEMGL